MLRSPRATLFMLIAVGLLLWGRLLLKEVPQTASAIEPTVDAAPAAAPPLQAASPSEVVPHAEERGKKTGTERMQSGQVGS